MTAAGTGGAARRRRIDRRIAVGVAGLIISGVPVRDGTVGPLEIAVFRAINRLPDRLYAPVWPAMQLGNAAAGPLAAAVALGSGRPVLARRLLASGLLSWIGAKVVKRAYRRERPSTLLTDTRRRGAEPTGLGYVSGHAGVALSLAVAVYPELARGGRQAGLIAAVVVGLSRIYVGAHLPLDVLGGATMGLAIEAVVERVLG